jgi:hypothetical protein
MLKSVGAVVLLLSAAVAFWTCQVAYLANRKFEFVHSWGTVLNSTLGESEWGKDIGMCSSAVNLSGEILIVPNYVSLLEGHQCPAAGMPLKVCLLYYEGDFLGGTVNCRFPLYDQYMANFTGGLLLAVSLFSAGMICITWRGKDIKRQ